MKKDNFKIFFGYLILIIVAVVTSVVGLYIASKIEEAELEKPSQYPDWYAIKGKNADRRIRAARITSECPTEGCVNHNPATVDFGEIHKKYVVIGKISRAYLYIEAVVDYQRPLTVWDDFYFKINEFGGHLMSDTNLLPVPPSNVSRFLYDFRSISYFPSIRAKEKAFAKQLDLNFFKLLQNGSTLDVIASISSDRPGRNMKEVSIYYECFKGSDCAIKEKN